MARALASRAGDHRAQARLVSTYFDTPDRALARQGLQLRVRQKGGHFIQTVKSSDIAGHDRLRRGEWEDPVAGAMPDPQAPESGPMLPAAATDHLVPLFRTEVRRATMEIAPVAGTQIEAAIDRGRIVATGRDAREPISEVELELKSGSAAALYDVALDLLAVAPVRLWGRSKAERGYQLAAAARPPVTAAHAGPVELQPEMSGDEALRRIGIACIEQILRNEAAVLADQPEGVHQMRVAVRRLRAVLSAFGKLLPGDRRRLISDELRWLADALGPARNLDVFEKSLLVPARAEIADRGMKALAEAVARRRKAAYTQAKKAVRSTRYTGLLLRLLRWFESCGWRNGRAAPELEQPIGGLAPAILDHRRRVVKRLAKGFAKQSAKTRHRLRIALKKQRYTIDVLAGLYPADAVDGFGKRLKRLQDDLGEANDVEAGRDIVADLAARSQDKTGIAKAGAKMLDWHERRLAEGERKLRKHIDGLLDATPFWSR